MNCYLVTYKDCGEWESETVCGMDFEDAEENFWNDMDEFGGPEGIEIVEIECKKVGI